MDKTNNKNCQNQMILAQLLKASKFEITNLVTILLSPLFKPVLLSEKCKGTNATPTFEKPSGQSRESQTLKPIRWSEARSKEQN